MAGSLLPPSSSSSSSSLRHTLWILVLVFSCSTSCFSTETIARTISYAKYCNSLVPESNSTGVPVNSTTLQFSNEYFSGGNTLFEPYNESNYVYMRSYSFFSHRLFETDIADVLKVEGELVIHGEPRAQAQAYYKKNTRMRHHSRRRIRRHIRRGMLLELSGFWSETTGKLCMVGHCSSTEQGNLSLSVILKVSHPKTSNIFNSFTTGTLESLDYVGSPNYFDSISLTAFTERSYEYTMLRKANESCSYLKVEEESLSSDLKYFCSGLRWQIESKAYVLEYQNDCKGWTCDPFGWRLGFSPEVFFLNVIDCSEDGTLRLHVRFSFSGNRYGPMKALIPETSFVGEGFWDQQKNRLCLMACHIRPSKSLQTLSVDDCNIGLCLWFPSVLSIRKMSTVIGRFWSTRNQIDDGYSNAISFSMRHNYVRSSPGARYEYTLDAVQNSCKMITTATNLTNTTYPIPYMGVKMSLRDLKGNQGYGTASVVSIGETYYGGSMFVREEQRLADTGRIWNISYELSYTWNASETFILAEGIFDVKTGRLCMIGCLRLQSQVPGGRGTNQKFSSHMDCSILINFQLPLVNGKADGNFSSVIRSTRNKTDPLYFEHFVEVSKFEYVQFAPVTNFGTSLNMKIDTGIILILSLTISCICFLAQFFHVKKHQTALPSISATMYVILNLAVITPLLLNFEALFLGEQNFYDDQLEDNFWFEVVKTIAGLLIVVVLLLQFCLIHVLGYAKPAVGRKHQLASKKKTIMLSLVLYLCGKLIAWFVQSDIYASQFPNLKFRPNLPDSLWDDMISYTCLVLECFLLPQLILNTLWNPRDRALTPSFYLGTTILQALPHFCNSYSVFKDWDNMRIFYSYVIPCQGLFLAFLVYLFRAMEVPVFKGK